MGIIELTVFLISALVTVLLTRVVMTNALKQGMMDVPNARSSHVIPTPRGGGLAIVLTAVTGTAVLCFLGIVEIRIAVVLVIAGSAIAAVGYMDDKHGLPALPRFAVHVAASVLVVLAFLCHSKAHNLTEPFDWVIALCLMIGTAWSINLFNFMDGIDGIAASQAVFVAGTSAALVFSRGDSSLTTLLLLSTGASAGFLIWNWPPAKIFMGDVGSGFLGFWLAALALLLHVEDVLNIWTSVTLSSVFLSDATVTLLRRVAGGKRWYEAHRSHAYQHMARRCNSHLRVTTLVWMLNALVILPLAVMTVLIPGAAAATAVVTVTTFAVLALIVGAGRDEQTQ